jgi:hypothetical protein
MGNAHTYKTVYNQYTSYVNVSGDQGDSHSAVTGPNTKGRGGDPGGRVLPVADGLAGPFYWERAVLFTSHSVLRTSFHYGKNEQGSISAYRWNVLWTPGAVSLVIKQHPYMVFCVSDLALHRRQTDWD